MIIERLYTEVETACLRGVDIYCESQIQDHINTGTYE